jgi:hypothetical protein
MFYESLRIGYVSIENDLALYIQILKKKKKKKKKINWKSTTQKGS